MFSAILDGRDTTRRARAEHLQAAAIHALVDSDNCPVSIASHSSWLSLTVEAKPAVHRVQARAHAVTTLRDAMTSGARSSGIRPSRPNSNT